MKKYETVKIDFISFKVGEDILNLSGIGPFVDEKGAIDGELDYASSEF